jgi:glycosyltransferase involved in cell wall biosynthesis
MTLMIYYLAHSDWILKQSRADIVKSIDTKYKITSICPLEENSQEIVNTYYESILWNTDKNIFFDILGIINLRKILIKIKKDDTLHIFTIKSLYMFIFASILFKKKFKVIVSITGLGFLFADTLLARTLRFITRILIILKINNSVDLIIFQNIENKKDFVKYSKYRNQIKIVEGSGLNTEKIKVKINQNPKTKVIFVGRLMKEKGVYEYLKIAKLMNSNTNFQFYLAGKPDFGNKSSISEEELQNIKNNTYVEYLGQINVYEELYKYDVLIQPSHHEGLSRILLESMYAGLYCICNDIPGIKEIIMKTNFGLLIKNNDIKNYIEELENFKLNPNLSNYGNAKIIINNIYSVEAIAKEFKNIYDEFA